MDSYSFKKKKKKKKKKKRAGTKRHGLEISVKNMM